MTEPFAEIRRKIYAIARRAGLAAAAVCAGFILIELSARVYFVFTLRDPAILLHPLTGRNRDAAIASVFPSMRRSGFRNYRPGLLQMYVAGTGRAVKLSPYKTNINSLGFRGGEITPRSDRRELRVACIGESSTFGYLLRDEDTYPARLQEILHRKLRRPVKVFNLGVSESTTDWQLPILREYLARVDPDIVTFYGCHNDIRDMIFAEKAASNIAGGPLIVPRIFRARLGARSSARRDTLSQESLNRVRNNLTGLAEHLRGRNIRFYFILQRLVRMQGKEGESYADLYKSLQADRGKQDILWNEVARIAYWHYPLIRSIAVAASANIRVVDPMPALDKSDFITHVHPDPGGAEKIAGHIAAEIVKDFSENK